MGGARGVQGGRIWGLEAIIISFFFSLLNFGFLGNFRFFYGFDCWGILLEKLKNLFFLFFLEREISGGGGGRGKEPEVNKTPNRQPAKNPPFLGKLFLIMGQKKRISLLKGS